jgi:hypothetical protein
MVAGIPASGNVAGQPVTIFRSRLVRHNRNKIQDSIK